MYQDIRYEVDGPVAVITLDRPHALNAWTTRMGAEFRHAVTAAEHDRTVVGIVITGAGRAFCAGADMNDLQSISGGAMPHVDVSDVAVERADPEGFDGPFSFLMAVQKPVVAAVHGAVAGMAFPLILSCDLRFMATDTVVLTAFAQRGLVAEWGSSWLLPRLVGTGHALDLLLSSRRVSGDEAAAMGLAQKALPEAEVLPYSLDYVRRLAERCSPTSMALMKRQVYEHLHGSLGPAEKEAKVLMQQSFGHPDFREGVYSFVEKRPPNFQRLGRD